MYKHTHTHVHIITNCSVSKQFYKKEMHKIYGENCVCERAKLWEKWWEINIHNYSLGKKKSRWAYSMHCKVIKGNSRIKSWNSW